VEVVEADQESRTVALVFPAYAVDLLFGGDPEFFRRQHDGRAMGIVGADVEAVVAAGLLEPHPDIGLHLLQQVAQVQRSIGVGQGAGDQDLARGGGSHLGSVSVC